MVINLIIFCLIFIILLIIINNINYYKPVNKIYLNKPNRLTWTPTVCDNYYQPCYPNWYYSEDYFYPI